MNEDQFDHEHDWRISPHKLFRDANGQRQYMLKCPTCAVTGWGHEAVDVSEWPRWAGVVDEIEK